jgi:ABC-type proline/glycine betaine transport system substrate-binding protein
MKRILATAVVAALLTTASHAQAPAPGEPITTSKINITLEQHHIIKEIIKTLPIAPAAATVDMSLGSVAPRDAHLQPMPAEVAAKVPQIKSHLFFVKEGKIAIVDPKDNRIAEIID